LASGKVPVNRTKRMQQSIGYVAVVVQDYDEVMQLYVDTLGFRLVEDLLQLKH
jgi:hypothetical protein